ncbi:MAG: L,D-transpeptidase family protein [Gammaproteobacteria bacterium]|nr:L,D-transpeptidase family protein [Gammaproteobacteria bacterium]MCP4091716.1 L,D-transpeptidase family protein [Gammaproteobacteria bacterium]MCP4275023.1 L,D-transpeptidase family protein [Gammaproteobacteria bacterium]MCP4831846.1 L,D-transpeptidase family protein [Gammaproteobacteria bacterium]MCP4929782.1 L,D-transpeptidase family protein [Gammaproteobacteria bacterium]
MHAADTASSSAAAWLSGEQVERLDQAITFYTAIRDQGGWQPLPEGPELNPGMRHLDVPLIRSRLRDTHDYIGEMNADPLFFDVYLGQAIAHFQVRYGLPGSGRLDRLTRSLLSVPVDELLVQLLQARTDWQALSSNLTDVTDKQHIWVNVPEALVSAIRGDQIELSMRAVVGRPERPTPILSSHINKVVVNPSWTVPRSIATQDILPRQQANINFLARNHIRVYQGWDEDAPELDPQTIEWDLLSTNNFPYRLRQDPGPGNSLGKFKFNFPNKYNVYLHDTPVPGLLDLSYRSLSSGCVRVADSERLARWLIDADSQVLLSSLLQKGSYKTYGIPVTRDIQINFVYITAWVAIGENTVQFRRDLYKRSSANSELLGQVAGL